MLELRINEFPTMRMIKPQKNAKTYDGFGYGQGADDAKSKTCDPKGGVLAHLNHSSKNRLTLNMKLLNQVLTSIMMATTNLLE